MRLQHSAARDSDWKEGTTYSISIVDSKDNDDSDIDSDNDDDMKEEIEHGLLDSKLRDNTFLHGNF